MAAQVRDLRGLIRLREKVETYRVHFKEIVKVSIVRTLPILLKTYDMIVTQCAVLEAMEQEQSAMIFGSRGSWISANQKLRPEFSSHYKERKWLVRQLYTRSFFCSTKKRLV